jgi:hypothetical protein
LSFIRLPLGRSRCVLAACAPVLGPCCGRPVGHL